LLTTILTTAKVVKLFHTPHIPLYLAAFLGVYRYEGSIPFTRSILHKSQSDKQKCRFPVTKKNSVLHTNCITPTQKAGWLKWSGSNIRITFLPLSPKAAFRFFKARRIEPLGFVAPTSRPVAM
jgi:hypothetical protein